MVWFLEMSPAFLMFLGLSFSGVILVFLSMSFIGVWFGLECNFFGFIPLLNGKTVEESEGSMKYFIVQGLGSSFIFMGVCLLILENSGLGLNMELLSVISFIMMVLGLLVKVGLFPFHFWFPSVMGSSSFFNCFMLSSWQKVGIFYVLSGLSFLSELSNFLIVTAVITGMVGGLGGVGQVFIRPLMAYSSLVHSGWMVVVSLVSEFYFFIYFFTYMLIILYLFRFVNYNQMSSLATFRSKVFMVLSGSWVWVIVNLLSLGGLPPMLGASIKFLGILTCVPVMGAGVMFLVFSSVVGLFYYLSILFSSSLWFTSISSLSFVEVVYRFKLVGSVFFFVIVNSVLGIIFFMSVGYLMFF